MTAIESATQFIIGIANDASHGYDQIYRWGEKGDYDCSALVITSWQQAGVPVKTNGATYSGNMYPVFVKTGFKDVTSSCNLSNGSGMKRGDVLLKKGKHAAMYIGNGKVAQASINEKGTAKGGKPGDQKQLQGKKGEINVCAYYNYPWNAVLRYVGGGVVVSPTVPTATKGYLSEGDYGEDVRTMQKKLIALGYDLGPDGADADFGPKTKSGLIAFQKDENIEQDGKYGPISKSHLETRYNALGKSNSDKIILKVDEEWGVKTTKRTQQYFGTVMDGEISDQYGCYRKYLINALTSSWDFVYDGKPKGSLVIKSLQAMIGEKVDGHFGPSSIKSFQKFLKNAGYYTGRIDGYLGPKNVSAWQRYLNDH